MRNYLLLMILASAFFLGFPQQAEACLCHFGGGVVCEDFWKARAVFVGTVIESRRVIIKSGDYDRPQRLVRFSIDEGLRGVEGPEIEVYTGLGDSDCGFAFRVAQQYLVYAHDNQGRLVTGICSRTRSIDSASEDLAYARGLATAKPGGKLNIGFVKDSRSPEGVLIQTPIAGMTVKIEGSPGAVTRKSDAKGSVTMQDLPAGEYSITANVPDGLMTPQPQRKVMVPDRGCTNVYFGIESDGRLNGRVLNANGLPVSKAEIFIVQADKDRRGHWDDSYSDENGHYAFNRVPPGRYVLIIRFDGMTSQNRPFPLLYYPGVSEKTNAKVITLADGQRIGDFDLTMPPLPGEVMIEGRVVGADGRPVTGARAQYLVQGGNVAYGVPLDSEGQFKFKAYEGLKLVMQALREAPNERSVYSDWLVINVVPGLKPATMVLPQR